MNVGSDASAYAEHSDWLDGMLKAILAGQAVEEELLGLSLDGHAAAEARRLLSRDFRRNSGAFFTPSSLRAEVSVALAGVPGRRYLDPTCGAGDLLLAASQQLPLRRTLRETVALWGNHLSGWDLHREFVDAARRRIILHAASRHISARGSALCKVTDYEGFLPKLAVGDALSRLEAEDSMLPNVILLNPPYGRVSVPSDVSWASGTTSGAAVFVMRSLDYLSGRGDVLAILPDVLRSGSSFARWRTEIEARAEVRLVKSVGQFDPFADVDVFLLALTVRSGRAHGKLSSGLWWRSAKTDTVTQKENESTVGEKFDVRVGPVVDNRDSHAGAERPFLIARDLPAKGRLGKIDRKRRFDGRVFKPPFVVVRRTSRPSQNGNIRAGGVLITGPSEIAVDNHLLVVVPKSGLVKDCKDLLTLLAAPATTETLDERIRCRHLTVGVIRDLPWRLAEK